jgi:hypothetical protein
MAVLPRILVEGEEDDPASSQADVVVGSLAEAVAWLSERENA